MVYMSIPDETGKWGFIMREAGTNKLLWSKVSSDFGVQPKWSPGDTFVAVVITKDDEIGDQIYIIDREGVEAQVINTNTIGINVVEWSPDGKRLSYGSTNVLAIYDFASDQLQEFQSLEEIWSIVWSPVGDQIEAGRVLIDLPTDCIFPFKPNELLGPYAWLIGEP
jgi:dipeptidyl aminopeptidase/acylaminoacyl peptidase